MASRSGVPVVRVPVAAVEAHDQADDAAEDQAGDDSHEVRPLLRMQPLC